MKKYLLAAAIVALIPATAHAGPFIIDGTDADDHGYASGGVNVDGWLYIQKSLENIAAGSGLTNTNKRVAIMGSTSGSQAGNAVVSAINANLAGSGWSFVFVDGVTNINNFFNGTGAVNTNNVSVLYFDSGANVGGGADSAEQAAFTANAMGINNFVGAGGGLFSHSQGYGWLSALIPGLTTNSYSDTGLTLTPAGNAAFPGLTNGHLSSGPWHNYFSNTGVIPVLATGAGPNGSQVAVILGGAGGSITNPTGGVPEPSTWAMMMLGFGAMGFTLRRRTQQKMRVRFA